MLTSAGFVEPTGEGWPQVAELAIAFMLAGSIGLERQIRQKSAGLRTYTLVGLGAALFTLLSKYGFTDVLHAGTVVLDPSRVTAQIVSGLGFIGAGVIFVHRGSVRGLTTAAAIWLTAAIGAVAAAGLPLLAALATGGYFLACYGLRPLARHLVPGDLERSELRITYLDGRGLLRSVIDVCTSSGFAVSELRTLSTGRADATSASSADDDGPAERPVQVALLLDGQADMSILCARMLEISGVLSCSRGEFDSE